MIVTPSAPTCPPSPAVSGTTRSRRHASRVPRIVPVLVLAFALAAGAQAAPVVHCVGTVQELRNAVAATNGSWQAFDLRIRSGYYAFTQDGSHTHALRFRRQSYDYTALENRTFRISGAWNAGCTQQAEQITAVNSTVLDGQDLIGVIQFIGLAVNNPISDLSTVRVDRLQIARGRSIHANPMLGRSGCFAYNLEGGNTDANKQANFAFEFDRVRMELCEYGGLTLANHTGASVRNSYFLGNSGPSGSALVVTSQRAGATIYNNTFRNNVLTGTSHAATVKLLGSPYKYFFNNLIAENSHPPGAVMTDLLADGTTFVRNNRLVHVVGDLGSIPLLLNNTSAAPGFLNTWNPRLSAGSALRDLGHTAAHHPGVGSLDFDGNARVQGAAVDIGAHELEALAPVDTLFANGFD